MSIYHCYELRGAYDAISAACVDVSMSMLRRSLLHMIVYDYVSQRMPYGRSVRGLSRYMRRNHWRRVTTRQLHRQLASERLLPHQWKIAA